jgi:hypothetical protein
MFMINGHQAFISRNITITRADGSVFFQTGYISVQSEIMTAITFLSSIARSVGAWRASGILWRCVLLFMEQGQVSLTGVKRILGKWPISPSDVTMKRHFVFFSALLVVSLILDFASPVLTGSITWNPSYAYVRSNKPLSTLPGNVAGLSIAEYKTNPAIVQQMVSTSSAMGDITWGTTGTNSTLLTRVVPAIDALANQSLIRNITIPYFAVDAFEWIQDPNSVLTTQQKAVLFNYTGYSPYVTPTGVVGLIPDQQWGLLPNENMTEPLIVSETRVLSLRTKYAASGNSGCQGDDDTIPSSVGRYHYSVGGSDECFVFAHLTYRAGVAFCDHCAITAPAVIQSDRSRLTLAPDSLTAEALAITPYVGMNLMVTGWSVPQNPPFKTTQESTVEFISRSYQSAWSSLTDTFGSPTFETDVQIAVPTTQARITKWRVLLWVGLHLVVMAASLFTFALHQNTSYPWLEDPGFSVLFLDTEELRRRQVWGENDPWKPNVHIPDVTLSLAYGGSRRRRIVVHNPMQKA